MPKLANTSAYLSPNDVAARLGVSWAKVVAWIKSGQLLAVNVASRPSGKPQWRIAESDLDFFLATRQAQPSRPATRRRRPATTDMIEFF